MTDTTTTAPAATDAPSLDAKRTTPRRSAADKLKWKAVGDDDARTGRVTAVVGDVTYSVVPAKDGKWKATRKEDGKTVVLVTDVGRGKAYQVAVRHHHGELVEAV